MSVPLTLFFLLPDHSDGYPHPQRGERPPLQQCSHVPGSSMFRGALSQRRTLQPPAGRLWMRLPQWFLRGTLSEQWVSLAVIIIYPYSHITFVFILLQVKQPQTILMLKKHVTLNIIVKISMIGVLTGLRSRDRGSVKLQWIIVTVQIVLFPPPTLFGFSLKGYMAAFWLLLKRSMSGTEISRILCNTACSWLTSMEGELLLSFSSTHKTFVSIVFCLGKVIKSILDMWCLFHVRVIMYWFQTKAAVMKMMKRVNWIFMKCAFQELHIPFIIFMSLCQTYTHSGPICLTYSVTSPLTLCVWLAVPFTLIKTTNEPTLPLAPFAHTPLPSALITEPSVLLIGMFSPLPLHSHLREVCRRNRGHRLWRADVHRVPQCCYKEVRKRTRGSFSSIQLHPTSAL